MGIAINPRVLLRGVLLIVSLAVFGLLLKMTGIDAVLSESWIDTHVRGQGIVGELLFVGIGILSTGAGFPRQVIAFLGGYAFGAWEGSLLALSATVGGCLAAFGYARLFGRHVIGRRFPRRVQQADAFLSDHPFLMTLLVRMLPVGNNLITNLVAGVTSIAALPFVAGSALGYVPQTVALALAGSGVHLAPITRIGMAIALFTISSAIAVHLYRRYRHGRTFDDAVEQALEDRANNKPTNDLSAAGPGRRSDA